MVEQASCRVVVVSGTDPSVPAYQNLCSFVQERCCRFGVFCFEAVAAHHYDQCVFELARHHFSDELGVYGKVKVGITRDVAQCELSVLHVLVVAC